MQDSAVALYSVGHSIRQFARINSVRLWVLRIGLYRLRLAPLGPRWALICDHTATG